MHFEWEKMYNSEYIYMKKANRRKKERYVVINNYNYFMVYTSVLNYLS